MYVSGIARLRGSRACSADGQQDFRWAVRRVGDVGAVSRALWLAAVPHRYGGALCALDHTGVYLFPLNNIVFAPPQKLLMRLARIKRAYNVRTCAAHVRRHTRRRAMRGWSRIALERCCGCATCLSFPLEQHRFCAPAKTLDASCAHQEGGQRPNAGANIRRRINGGFFA